MCRRIPLFWLFKSATLFSTLCFGLGNLSAQDRIQAYEGAKLYPITADPIEEGTILVQNGKIIAVGSVDEIDIPDGAFLSPIVANEMIFVLTEEAEMIAFK